MTTNEHPLFHLLTPFQNWANGATLDDKNMVQHELILAHLARLYGNIVWNAQVFGLCHPYQGLDIQQNNPTITQLMAVTTTGKLMISNETPIPNNDNTATNNGLFAIANAEHYRLPQAFQQQQLLYGIQLQWMAWETGINNIVKPGNGLPLGRYINNQWDQHYAPPVVNLATSDILHKRMAAIMAQVTTLINYDTPIQGLALELGQQTLWQTLTPLELWRTHCRCLTALLNNTTLANDKNYQNKVSNLSISGYIPWEFGNCIEKLQACWQRIKTRLDHFILTDNQGTEYILPEPTTIHCQAFNHNQWQITIPEDSPQQWLLAISKQQQPNQPMRWEITNQNCHKGSFFDKRLNFWENDQHWCARLKLQTNKICLNTNTQFKGHLLFLKINRTLDS